MRPALPDVLEALAAQGTTSVRLIPVFFGSGGHVKEDLPRLVKSFQEKHAGCRVDIEAAIGEQESVLEAIAAAIAQENP
jgi:sirohydrochlorin cobaltochelatase